MEKLSDLKVLRKDPVKLRKAAETKLAKGAALKPVKVEAHNVTVDAERILKWCAKARARHVVVMLHSRNDQYTVAYEQGYAMALTELLAFVRGSKTKAAVQPEVEQSLEALPSLSEIEAEGENNGY